MMMAVWRSLSLVVSVRLWVLTSDVSLQWPTNEEMTY